MADAAVQAAAGIDVECIVEAGDWPPEDALHDICVRSVAAAAGHAEAAGRGTLTILFSDDAVIQALNARFRGKDKPTNVLSFPAPAAATMPGAPRHIGDIALAYETVAREAETERKPFEHHLTHLVVHGFLHLFGYDHETPEEAEEMENLERRILESLAIGDPYA